MLKKLQTKGLIKKVRDKADERVVYIELTAAGKAMQKDAVKRWEIIATVKLCEEVLAIQITVEIPNHRT